MFGEDCCLLAISNSTPPTKRSNNNIRSKAYLSDQLHILDRLNALKRHLDKIMGVSEALTMKRAA